MYRTIISFKTLFCFLLFVSPFVEFVIPGGDMYLACVVGVVAFVGVGLEAKGRQNTFVVTIADVLFWICWGYAVIRMPLPVDMALCIKLVAVTGIWCYCRLNVTPELRNMVIWWMIVAGFGAVCHRTATRLWGVKELPFRVCFDRNVWKSRPFWRLFVCGDSFIIFLCITGEIVFRNTGVLVRVPYGRFFGVGAIRLSVRLVCGLCCRLFAFVPEISFGKAYHEVRRIRVVCNGIPGSGHASVWLSS